MLNYVMLCYVMQAPNGLFQICVVERANIMSLLMRKPTICICENKDADQLRGNREADQRLCFRYTDSTSTIPLLSKSKFPVSSHLLCLYSPVCVGPVRKPHCWFSHKAALMITVAGPHSVNAI